MKYKLKFNTLKYNLRFNSMRRYYKNITIGNGGIDEHTVLLLHGEDFTDSSLNPRSITNSGVTIDSGGKFGNCLKMSGSGYLRRSTIVFGTSNFTFDTWIKLIALPTSDAWPTNWSSHMSICGVGSAGLADGFNLVLGQTRIMMQSNDSQFIYGSHGMVINEWYHLAAVRNGNNFKLYVNGEQKASVDSSITAGTGAYCWIGCETGEGAYLNGYLDELRISNIARWTANFTPPAEPYSRTQQLIQETSISDYDFYTDTLTKEALTR